MNTDFLPEGYEPEVGSSNGYMKFQSGENRFRILTRPIIGLEWWVDKDGEVRQKGQKPETGDKPVRVKKGENIPVSAADVYREFWAMVVWNYKEQRVQILQIHQFKIKGPITILSKDDDWGSPLGYDLVVTRTGEGLETDYSVTPKPAKAIDPKITEVFNSMDVNLEALYDGGNPFAKTDQPMNEVVEDEEMDSIASELT